MKKMNSRRDQCLGKAAECYPGGIFRKGIFQSVSEFSSGGSASRTCYRRDPETGGVYEK